MFVLFMIFVVGNLGFGNCLMIFVLVIFVVLLLLVNVFIGVL